MHGTASYRGLEKVIHCPAMRTFLVVLAALATSAGAQPEFPTKPVRIISGAPPGTPGDVVVRLIAEPLAARLGQPVVVENRPGAINTIGLAAVAKAKPDGYTLGILGMPSTVAPSLLSNVPYDTLRDLMPVRQLSWVSNVLVVRSGAGFGSLSELVTAAKARPQRLTYASGGNGTPAHLAAELFKLTAGIEMRHVPFKGASAGVGAVLGEQVDMMFAVAPSVVTQIQSGKLRALATPAPSRLARFPQVPTLAELGYAVDVRDWHGIVGPAAMARPALEALEAALSAVLAMNDVRERLVALGLEPAQSSPAQFRGHIAAELERWSRVVREAGIRAD
jgi:tripartite-type tricarboxylate transporter receptor subunit TctC